MVFTLSSKFKVTNFSRLLRIAGVLVLCGHATAVSAADSDAPADIFSKLPPAADIKLSLMAPKPSFFELWVTPMA